MGNLSDVRYFGYDTHDVARAIDAYRNNKGQEPTLVIARPDFPLENENEIVFRSRFGMGEGLLVTHMATVDEMAAREKTGIVVNFVPKGTGNGIYKGKVPLRRPGRPVQDGGDCPHCGQHISDFNSIGHWHGWVLGKYPPYWDALREYVFARDKYTCATCRRRLPAPELRCHHIIAKEIGGSDSARNLITLCGPCHPDEHPIFEDRG